MILRSIIFTLALAVMPALADDTNFTTAEWSPVDLKQVIAAGTAITPDK